MHVESLENRKLLSAAAATAPPRYDHVVVIIEENHSFNPILGRSLWPPTAFSGFEWPYIFPLPLEEDPYIRHLASTGAIFTQSHGIGHPSQPNYLALFSGSTQGVTSDATPRALFNAPNLASELAAAGDTFAQYSESLPRPEYAGGDVGNYVRHHNPAVQFSNVPAADNQPFSAFPKRFSDLPTVSFVVPNLVHDMHSGYVVDGDQWLRRHFNHYVKWARRHNSLLIVTWDESGPDSSANQVPTFFVGAHIRPGHYAQPIDHLNVLGTIEDMYALTPTAQAADARPITEVFKV